MEFAASREPSVSSATGDRQPNLSIYNLPLHCRGRTQAQGCHITHRYQQQVHCTWLKALLGLSSHFILSSCYTELTGSCTKPKGNSTRYWNPEAHHCLAAILNSSQSQCFNFPSLISALELYWFQFSPNFLLFAKGIPQRKGRKQV